MIPIKTSTMHSTESIVDTIDIRSPQEHALKNWEAQKDTLIKLGFHTLRGMSEEAYRALLPDYQPPSADVLRTHPFTVLVDPLDPLKQIHDHYIIEDDISDRFAKLETLQNAQGVTTPDVPYQVSLSKGIAQRDKTMPQVLSSLSEHERLITLAEGLALWREHREIWLEDRTDLSPYGISTGGTTIRVATGGKFHEGKFIFSEEDRAATPEISEYLVFGSGDPLPHKEIHAFHSETNINTSGGWPTAKVA